MCVFLSVSLSLSISFSLSEKHSEQFYYPLLSVVILRFHSPEHEMRHESTRATKFLLQCICLFVWISIFFFLFSRSSLFAAFAWCLPLSFLFPFLFAHKYVCASIFAHSQIKYIWPRRIDSDSRSNNNKTPTAFPLSLLSSDCKRQSVPVSNRPPSDAESVLFSNIFPIFFSSFLRLASATTSSSVADAAHRTIDIRFKYTLRQKARRTQSRALLPI